MPVPTFDHIPVAVVESHRPGDVIGGTSGAFCLNGPGADGGVLFADRRSVKPESVAGPGNHARALRGHASQAAGRYREGHDHSGILGIAVDAFRLDGLADRAVIPAADTVKAPPPVKSDPGKPDQGRPDQGKPGQARVIGEQVVGSVILGPADNPLSITASGTIASTGSGVDGIDGPPGSHWTITNDGTITSAGGLAIGLSGSGTVINGPTRGTAIIAGADAAVKIEQRPGSLNNAGSIVAASTAIDFRDGGSIINGLKGSVHGDRVGVFITGADGTVMNSGAITGRDRIGVDLAHGGGITNAAGASIAGNVAGVFFAGGDASLTNAGRISATGAAGADIESGGAVTNSAGASIAGSSFGIFTAGGAGAVVNDGAIDGHDKFGVDLTVGGSVVNGETASIKSAAVGIGIYGGGGKVTNLGAISGGADAIRFSNGGNLLVAGPKAAFSGGVVGGTATGNTLELAGGTGTIDGLVDGAGAVTANGRSWSFSHFDMLRIGEGGAWTVRDGHTAPMIINSGTVTIAGTLHVSKLVGSDSPGLFQLQHGAELIVKSIDGAKAQIRFGGDGRLVFEEAGSSDADAEHRAYRGPQLQNFGTSDAVILGQFSPSRLALSYDPSSGLLQVSNATQVATIAFQPSSLAKGRWEATDGGSGATSIIRKSR